MNTAPYRLRSQSLSDTHIMQCGCTLCDGSGILLQEERDLPQRLNECPECEGHGFLLGTTEITSNTIGLAPEISRVIPLSKNYVGHEESLRQAA